MAEPATTETNASAIEAINSTLANLQRLLEENKEAIDGMEIPEAISPTEFATFKQKAKENFSLLEKTVRDCFSQIEKNAQSIKTCIDEIRVVGGSVHKLKSPASVSSPSAFTLLEL